MPASAAMPSWPKSTRRSRYGTSPVSPTAPAFPMAARGATNCFRRCGAPWPSCRGSSRTPSSSPPMHPPSWCWRSCSASPGRLCSACTRRWKRRFHEPGPDMSAFWASGRRSKARCPATSRPDARRIPAGLRESTPRPWLNWSGAGRSGSTRPQRNNASKPSCARFAAAFPDPAAEVVAGLWPEKGGSGQIRGLVTGSEHYDIAPFRAMLDKVGVAIPPEAVAVG